MIAILVFSRTLIILSTNEYVLYCLHLIFQHLRNYNYTSYWKVMKRVMFLLKIYIFFLITENSLL